MRAAHVTEVDQVNSIIARLKADGWEEELDHPSAHRTLEYHSAVKQPKELTDRIWEAIKPTLTVIMSNLRAAILEQKIQDAVAGRLRLLERLGDSLLSKLPETLPNPPASALGMYQPFLDIVQTTPHDKDVTTKLEEALETVPVICEEWRQEHETRLRAILRETGRRDDLSLVVNAFTCADCCRRSLSVVLHYPHFASHRCFYSTARVGGTNVWIWNGKGTTAVNLDVYARCKDFVRMCGLDPHTATAEDMDGVDMFFQCEECDSRRISPPGTRLFGLMRWRTAMNHQHLGMMSRVEDADLIASGRRQENRLLEKDLLSKPAGHAEFSQAFVCLHCDMPEASRTARARHLQDAHGIEGEVKIADHYRRSLKDKHVNKLVVGARRMI
ncbi:hypothetical protein BDZ89DRAFT_1046801 [Hymenopellis radicata]|nr:hypothetical protein BDZ89DRAFT_1046801 [Hymenopellis radicata]